MTSVDINALIDVLSDTEAVRLLYTYAEARGLPEPTRADVEAARNAIDDPEPSVAPADQPTDGDVARAMLRLLALDPQVAQTLHALLEEQDPRTRSFAGAEIVILGAVVAVLMTEFTIEKTPDGKTSWVFKKKPISTDELKVFFDVVSGWFKGLGD